MSENWIENRNNISAHRFLRVESCSYKLCSTYNMLKIADHRRETLKTITIQSYRSKFNQRCLWIQCSCFPKFALYLLNQLNHLKKIHFIIQFFPIEIELTSLLCAQKRKRSKSFDTYSIALIYPTTSTLLYINERKKTPEIRSPCRTSVFFFSIFLNHFSFLNWNQLIIIIQFRQITLNCWYFFKKMLDARPICQKLRAFGFRREKSELKRNDGIKFDRALSMYFLSTWKTIHRIYLKCFGWPTNFEAKIKFSNIDPRDNEVCRTYNLGYQARRQCWANLRGIIHTSIDI